MDSLVITCCHKALSYKPRTQHWFLQRVQGLSQQLGKPKDLNTVLHQTGGWGDNQPSTNTPQTTTINITKFPKFPHMKWLSKPKKTSPYNITSSKFTNFIAISVPNITQRASTQTSSHGEQPLLTGKAGEQAKPCSQTDCTVQTCLSWLFT